jgi:hypothetical protein
MRVITHAGALLGVAWIVTFAGWRTHAAPAFEIEETTIAKIHAAMRSKQLTCRDLVSAYLERIAAKDKKEPPLNAIVETNPNALWRRMRSTHSSRSRVSGGHFIASRRS